MVKKFELIKPVFDLHFPTRPTKPTEGKIITVDKVFYQESTKTSTGKSVNLLEALKKIPKEVPLEEVKISFTRPGNVYDFGSISSVIKIHHVKNGPNPNYQTALDAYNLAVGTYDKELVVYHREHDKYGQMFLLWDHAIKLKKLKAKKKRTKLESAQIKAIPVAMAKLLKKLELKFTPAQVLPLAAPKPALIPYNDEEDDEDDYYDDDY